MQLNDVLGLVLQHQVQLALVLLAELPRENQDLDTQRSTANLQLLRNHVHSVLSLLQQMLLNLVPAGAGIMS